MVRKDLGMVTAYAYAVSKGYTGTEAEFAELMASYATVAEAADASAQAAASSASSAAGSATNASGSASAAAGSASAAASSASTASTKASESATSATAAAGSATTASTKAGEAASSASAAAQSATQAAGSASTAAQSATNANTAKTDAQTAKTAAETAQEKAEEAQAAAEAAAQTLVIDDTLTQANQAAEAKAVGDALKTKAEIDGYYQDMTVGDAEQLVSSLYVEDNAPYKFRTSGGSADIGNREYVDKIIGGTVAWNQFIHPASAGSASSNGITFTNNGDGSWSISGTATADAYRAFIATTTVAGHKYLFKGAPSTADASSYYDYLVGTGAIEQKNETGSGVVVASPNGGAINCVIYVKNGVELSTAVVFKPQLFDLTQMFGSTIANAVYAMEQATAGAGVAWFRKLFPNDYYAYNAGELISVSGLQSHDMAGFNQWDEEWEIGSYNTNTGEKRDASNCIRSKNFIRVMPGTTYYLQTSASSLGFLAYDADKKYLRTDFYAGGRTFRTPDRCHYLRFYVSPTYGTTYKNDICINLSWSGTRNGEYEPYEKHSYPLDSTLTLRGIPKLSADNQLYFDGDEYLPEGKVNRRYGVVDLGTLTWTRNADSNGGYYFISNVISTMKKQADNYAIWSNLIIGKAYSKVASATIALGTASNFAYGGHDSGAIRIKDDTYTDAATFKAAMSGVMLVYELETPTEETAEAYQAIQLVDDWGTEEYVSGTICPVGHETRYPANLRDKLQHLPDLASADGYYVVQQTGRQMSLVYFRIPQAPAADGTYTLKATVSGGVPTYTWEVVT